MIGVVVPKYVYNKNALQLSAQRPSSPQLSARTPAAECVGQVESVIVGNINKEKFPIISVYLFPVLCIC